MAVRYGGEEFAVRMPQSGPEASCKLSDSLRKAIAEVKPVKSETTEPLGKVTVPFGLAAFRSGDDLVVLIERADGAPYAAKAGWWAMRKAMSLTEEGGAAQIFASLRCRAVCAMRQERAWQTLPAKSPRIRSSGQAWNDPHQMPVAHLTEHPCRNWFSRATFSAYRPRYIAIAASKPQWLSRA